MHNISCRSIRDNPDLDFRQLSALVKNIRAYLISFRTDQEHIRFASFELSQQLVTSLQNLDDLLTALFEETETQVSEEQRKCLTICEQMVATFYCFIHDFIELRLNQSRDQGTLHTSEQAGKLAYEFYFNAAYELRTPYFVLKGYSQSQMLEAESEAWRTFMGQVYSPPLVPENQDKVYEINYWIEELGKFIADLPRLRQESEDAA